MSLETQPDPLHEERLAGDYTVEIVRNSNEWDGMEVEWRRLFVASPFASPPLCWEWTRTWWRIYGAVYAERSAGDEGLRIFAVRKNGALVCVLPLYLRRSVSLAFGTRRLCFLSTGEAEFEETCAEHLDILCLLEDIEPCMALILEVLFNSVNRDWDELHLSPVTANSPLNEWCKPVEAGGLYASSNSLGPAFIADATDGFDAYLGKLSANSRGLARKRAKGALRDGACFEVADTPELLEEMWGQLVSLHQIRWEAEGKPGCFSAPRFCNFHKSLLLALLESGSGILARLSLDGEPLAVMLGYIACKKFDSYVAGAKFEEERIKSPGIALHLLLMELLTQRGLEKYDHMSGTMRYKQQFSTHEVETFQLIYHRPTIRTQVNRMSEAIKEVVRNGKKMFKDLSKSNDSAKVLDANSNQ